MARGHRPRSDRSYHLAARFLTTGLLATCHFENVIKYGLVMNDHLRTHEELSCPGPIPEYQSDFALLSQMIECGNVRTKGAESATAMPEGFLDPNIRIRQCLALKHSSQSCKSHAESGLHRVRSVGRVLIASIQ